MIGKGWENRPALSEHGLLTCERGALWIGYMPQPALGGNLFCFDLEKRRKSDDDQVYVPNKWQVLDKTHVQGV
jgi:hypothetical protein